MDRYLFAFDYDVDNSLLVIRHGLHLSVQIVNAQTL